MGLVNLLNREKKFLKVLKSLNDFFTENINFKKGENNEIIKSLLQHNQYYKTKSLDDAHLNVSSIFILNRDNFKACLKQEKRDLKQLLDDEQFYSNRFLIRNQITAYLIVFNRIESHISGLFRPVCFLLDSYTEHLFKRINVDFAKVSYFTNFPSFYYKLKGVCMTTIREQKNQPNMYA